MAPFAINSSGAGTNTIYTGYGAQSAAVRQMLGRPGEVWGAESGTDRLVRIRTR
jgi:streptogramin lyase